MLKNILIVSMLAGLSVADELKNTSITIDIGNEYKQLGVEKSIQNYALKGEYEKFYENKLIKADVSRVSKLSINTASASISVGAGILGSENEKNIRAVLLESYASAKAESNENEKNTRVVLPYITASYSEKYIYLSGYIANSQNNGIKVESMIFPIIENKNIVNVNAGYKREKIQARGYETAYIGLVYKF